MGFKFQTTFWILFMTLFGMDEFEAENKKNDRYAVPVVFTNTC
ncbi:hypothetical protein NEIMUCOT_05244 [Neisseria mucosa ATCC 25996]|uniref:Uncharacterized protein n=1 Tax=Neisseria mucosa (strain ATCC 25996 / DSM 4631 / NCTC 10774 / M26) TaxID=546266 RepID=D2ZX95_NEIM2|nr:hypothetical protein NEIMUCOT_05244 [Neisseria mucosa ATCC 25996]